MGLILRDFEMKASEDRAKLAQTMTQLTRADLARKQEQQRLRESLGEMPTEVEELFRYTCPRLLLAE